MCTSVVEQGTWSLLELAESLVLNVSPTSTTNCVLAFSHLAFAYIDLVRFIG